MFSRKGAETAAEGAEKWEWEKSREFAANDANRRECQKNQCGLLEERREAGGGEVLVAREDVGQAEGTDDRGAKSCPGFWGSIVVAAAAAPYDHLL